jgi:integrase
MATLKKRGKQFWVSFNIDGKRYRKPLGTNNERVAKSRFRKLEYELTLGDLRVASKLPLETILEAFCRHLAATRTYKSYKNDFSRLRVFFGPVCKSLEPGSKHPAFDKYAGRHVQAKLLEDITPQAINRFLSARIEQDNWSAKTANLIRQLLHKLFVYAGKHHGFVSRDRRYPNPASGVDRRREAAPQIRFLKLEQIQKQLEVLENYPTIHAMVATYIYAGLRREAGTWLRREDVDLDKRLIRVQAKTVDDKYWQPKTRKNRVVPISKALHEILSAYNPPHKCIWFFPSPKGKRWNPDNFSQDLRKINKKNGLNWGCLEYRHTFGSHLAIKGESLYKISTLMGNSPGICRKHYAALIPEEMADVVEFSRSRDADPESPDDDSVKAVLELVLKKLDGAQTTKPESPRLRMLPPQQSA